MHVTKYIERVGSVIKEKKIRTHPDLHLQAFIMNMLLVTERAKYL